MLGQQRKQLLYSIWWFISFSQWGGIVTDPGPVQGAPPLGGGGCPSCGALDRNCWYKGEYYTYQELEELKHSESIEIGVVYAPYVPTIIPERYGTLLKKYGHLFGENEKPTDSDCGDIFRKVQCTVNALHHPSFRHVRCNDPGCPVCYVKFSARIASRVTERVQGYKSVFRRQVPYHLIFWSSKEDNANRLYPDLRSAFKEADRLLKIMGSKASVVWYHPYRIKAELKPHMRRWRRAHGLDGKIGFWKMAHDDVMGIGPLENYIAYGPHWHAISTGWLIKSDDFNEMTGGAGYKKKRYLEKESSVYEVAYYVSTHAAREYGKQSVRYYGDISYRMLERELVEEKIKDVLCLDCGAKLEEYDCNSEGVCRDKLKDTITEKIKYYLYWKRGTKKPEMKDAYQCLITRFDAYK